MASTADSGPDWRDAAAYAPLRDAERSLFAWEWLRRDPAYRAAALSPGLGSNAGPQGKAHDFGLVAFEDPDLPVPLARPLWRAESCPCVLRVGTLEHAPEEDLFDPRALAAFLTCRKDEEGQHLLLSDGWRTIRLDCPSGTFKAAPMGLRYDLHGIASAAASLEALRRFLALVRTGHFSPGLHPREARALRWVLQLRAADALAAGAGQRAIAEHLLSSSVEKAGWRVREPSVRSRVQRLVRGARQMAAGGYRALVQGASADNPRADGTRR